MAYNIEFYADWGVYEEIENLSDIDKVLTKSGINEYGYLYSDKFPNGYESSEYNIPNPYLDVNKFNKEWLTPN